MKIETLAAKFGFEYNHIENFPMAWYETWGYHTKDNIFDRFEPQNTAAEILKMFAQTIWFILYIAPIGIWLTAVGQVCRAGVNWIQKVTGLKKTRVEKQRIG